MIEKEVFEIRRKINDDIWFSETWGVGMCNFKLVIINFIPNLDISYNKITKPIPDEIYAKYCLWRLEQ